MRSSLECDGQWSQDYIELFTFIESKNFDNAYLDKVLASIQAEDHHWDWFQKSLRMRNNEYVWFFMYADDKPQGACLIFHPKKSAIYPEDIFYIEFVAVAPWNRTCLVRQRKYKDVGTTLISAALKHSTSTLKLRPGFSLHSLPRAIDYYLRLGMLPFPALDKDTLPYFEIPEDKASFLLHLP